MTRLQHIKKDVRGSKLFLKDIGQGFWKCCGRNTRHQATCGAVTRKWQRFYKHFFEGEDDDLRSCWPVEWRGMNWENNSEDSLSAIRWVENRFSTRNIKWRWLELQY